MSTRRAHYLERHEIPIEAAYLQRCSPEAAYTWLQQHQSKGKERPHYIEPGHSILEYLLLRRRDSLIDLALAQYAQDPRIVRRVYRRGDLGTRCGAWSNTSVVIPFLALGWFTIEDLVDLLRAAPMAELIAFASNPTHPNDLLCKLIGREEVFKVLSEERYETVLLALARNPRLATERDDTYMNGWADYDHSRVFSAAWRLAQTVPANQRWASILESLLQRSIEPTGIEDVDGLIARWRIDNPRKDDDKYHLPGSSFYLRSRLADLKQADQKLLDSEDLALRLSFYRRFQPWEFQDWPSFLDKDGNEFLEAALYNENLWRNPKERERLRSLTWKAPDPHHSMDMPNSFRARAAYYRKTRPECFADEDPAHELPRRIERIEEKLNELTGTPDSSGLVLDLAKRMDSLAHASPFDRLEATLDVIDSRLTSIERQLRERPPMAATARISDPPPEPAARASDHRSISRTIIVLVVGAALVLLLWRAFTG